jgi:hypothetical protein
MAFELGAKRFSSRQTMIPFYLDDEEFCLVELQGDQRDDYLNSISRRIKGGGDRQKIQNFKGMQAELLAMSVHHATLKEGTQLDENGNKKVIVEAVGDSVDIDTIKQWPASLQQQLFEETQRISGLGTSEEDNDREVKND